jgi:flavin-dependent dehydrogenase
MQDVVVVGGGLAGLVNAIQLARAGLQVLLIEKKQYPFHKVCGEYVSYEVLPFIQSLGIFPDKLGASHITTMQVTSPSGKNQLRIPLDLGGFGLSRYVLDNHLYQLALQAGAQVILGKSAEKIEFNGNTFQVHLSDGSLQESKLVVGAFGKRSKLDKRLNRNFINQRSPYVGVKYHLYTDFPKDLIALHNFQDGYCGVCAIEDNKYNLCYLTTRNNIKKYGSVEEMENQTMYKNPFLQKIRSNAVFLFDKPEVINEISFAPKKAVEAHILMSGDSAGLITPLCGNGMAMAIHAANILSGLIIRYYKESWTRETLENIYQQQWQQMFARRLWVGRQTQKLFGSKWVSSMAVGLLQHVKPAARFIMKQTHGKVFY